MVYRISSLSDGASRKEKNALFTERCARLRNGERAWKRKQSLISTQVPVLSELLAAENQGEERDLGDERPCRKRGNLKRGSSAQPDAFLQDPQAHWKALAEIRER